MSYRMLWWGPPLLWQDIVNINTENVGRWASGPLSTRSEFTDFAWVPRRSELHLFLEEIPKRDDIDISGARYFHVIFSHKTERVLHLDGAIRIYSGTEWDLRNGVHVHRTGKVGLRIKVFRIDDPIQPDAVSSLGASFFVWNDDVAHFFGEDVPPQFLGNDG